MEVKKSFLCSFPECQNRPPFSKNSNLTRHIEHMHRSEYVCSYENCSEIFSTRKGVIFHEKKQHRVKCELCNTSSIAHFKTIHQLKRHIRLVHEKRIRHNVHFCAACKLSFPSKTEYQLHQVNKHQSGGGGFMLHNSAMSGDHNDYRCEN